MIDVSHLLSHLLIFCGYATAMVLVPRAFSQLMRLGRDTQVGAGGFFITCGITHIGNALGMPYAWWVEVNDHLQAVFIAVFIFGLLRDLRRVVTNLAKAFVAIEMRYGTETRDVVHDTIREALES